MNLIIILQITAFAWIIYTYVFKFLPYNENPKIFKYLYNLWTVISVFTVSITIGYYVVLICRKYLGKLIC